MLKVGITGGIGSGKSFVAKLFVGLGYEVYDADSRAKALMLEDPELVAGVKGVFGEEAYLKDGSLNRARIAKLAFNDDALLEQLNALVHPAVARDSAKWFKAVSQRSDKAFALKEAALLYEAGSAKELDAIIVVTAPLELRLARVMKRDGVTKEQVLSRMDNQWPEEKKVVLADYVIVNDQEQPLLPQLAKVIHALNKRGKEKA